MGHVTLKSSPLPDLRVTEALKMFDRMALHPTSISRLTVRRPDDSDQHLAMSTRLRKPREAHNRF